MSFIPTPEDQRRHIAEEWERNERRHAQERFLDFPFAPPIPPDKKLIPNPYGAGSLLVPKVE